VLYSVLCRNYCCFSNHFYALSQFTVQLTIKIIPFKMYCGISVGWKYYCVHFVRQHAYINLNLFQFPKLCAVTGFISEGISKFIPFAVANMKTRHTRTNFELPTII